ncbi:glycosyltransferase [Povalibacter sp.]|uniref:glycosyltransferase n=1 Tax=Povalibacter sp. TaxID=1962978 RepID=UPI002F3EA702
MKSAHGLRILWIARYMPYPADAGAKVYSAKLAESLAAAGASVRFLGFGTTDALPEEARHVEWVPVPGERRSEWLALFSRLPNGAAVDASPGYRRLLEEQLREPWDAIVLDTYAAGWALDRCLAQRFSTQPPPVLVHVSHNHEGAVWRDLAAESSGSLPRRLVVWQNSIKVRALERRVVRNVDLLTTITDEDRAALTVGRDAPHAITLTPGYSGTVAAPRRIDAATPRRVAIVGSFHWVMKQENLRRFVTAADAVFAQNDIQLDVIGGVPDKLRAELAATARATTFHGFVDDPADYLARVRMAIVPEVIGGGFKLKFLDYLFTRVPIATLAGAAAGLPAALREQMLLRDNLDALTADIVADIDQFEVLNSRQERAFELARSLFRWQDRGAQLHRAITQSHRQQRASADDVSAQALKRLSASTTIK